MKILSCPTCAYWWEVKGTDTEKKRQTYEWLRHKCKDYPK